MIEVFEKKQLVEDKLKRVSAKLPPFLLASQFRLITPLGSRRK